MCFIFHQDHKEKKTATEDVAAFKVLFKEKSTGILRSPLYIEEYEVGVINTAELKEEEKEYLSPSSKICAGLHSYSSMESAEKMAKWMSTMFHYKTTPEKYLEIHDIVIMNAIIPKG